MKFVWKPLDINYYRLYAVQLRFARHPQWNECLIVAALSLREAVKMIEKEYEKIFWRREKPIIYGCLLKILQPDYLEWRDS